MARKQAEIAARRDARGYDRYPGSRIPFKADEMLNSNLAKVDLLHLLTLTNYTSGYNDTPARNPAYGAKWERELPESALHKFEPILMGKTAIIIDYSGGSFHERWLKLELSLIVNDLASDEEFLSNNPDFEYNPLFHKDIPKIKHYFKYNGMRDAVQELMNYESTLTHPTEDGDTSDEYWNRVMGTMPTPKSPLDKYRDDDNYFKK